MKRILAMAIVFCLVSTSAMAGWGKDNESTRESKKVQQQQAQYAKGQPLPYFNWSLERHLVIELYKLRNKNVATHSVWRGDTSIVEGDCPSMGFGLPYDTSLTNPLMSTDEDPSGYDKAALTSIGQAEPNGVFASTNTSATWVMCVGPAGAIEPVYVESKVTVYPGPVKVDYITNRVTRFGKSSVTIKTK